MSLRERWQRLMYRLGWGENPEETDMLGAQTREDIAVIRAMPKPGHGDFDLAKVIQDAHNARNQEAS